MISVAGVCKSFTLHSATFWHTGCCEKWKGRDVVHRLYGRADSLLRVASMEYVNIVSLKITIYSLNTRLNSLKHKE